MREKRTRNEENEERIVRPRTGTDCPREIKPEIGSLDLPIEVADHSPSPDRTPSPDATPSLSSMADRGTVDRSELGDMKYTGPLSALLRDLLDDRSNLPSDLEVLRNRAREEALEVREFGQNTSQALKSGEINLVMAQKITNLRCYLDYYLRSSTTIRSVLCFRPALSFEAHQQVSEAATKRRRLT